MLTISVGLTCRSTSCTAARPPKCLVTLLNSNRALLTGSTGSPTNPTGLALIVYSLLCYSTRTSSSKPGAPGTTSNAPSGPSPAACNSRLRLELGKNEQVDSVDCQRANDHTGNTANATNHHHRQEDHGVTKAEVVR